MGATKSKIAIEPVLFRLQQDDIMKADMLVLSLSGQGRGLTEQEFTCLSKLSDLTKNFRAEFFNKYCRLLNILKVMTNHVYDPYNFRFPVHFQSNNTNLLNFYASLHEKWFMHVFGLINNRQRAEESLACYPFKADMDEENKKTLNKYLAAIQQKSQPNIEHRLPKSTINKLGQVTVDGIEASHHIMTRLATIDNCMNIISAALGDFFKDKTSPIDNNPFRITAKKTAGAAPPSEERQQIIKIFKLSRKVLYLYEGCEHDLFLIIAGTVRKYRESLPPKMDAESKTPETEPVSSSRPKCR